MKLCIITVQTQLRLLLKNTNQNSLFVSRDYNLSWKSKKLHLPKNKASSQPLQVIWLILEHLTLWGCRPTIALTREVTVRSAWKNFNIPKFLMNHLILFLKQWKSSLRANQKILKVTFVTNLMDCCWSQALSQFSRKRTIHPYYFGK